MSQFNILYQESPFHFEAKAQPRSRSFKLKWTKENKRSGLIYNNYKIVIKIFEINEYGREHRRVNLEPQPLWPYNYKWDVGRGGPMDPNREYKVKIYLQCLSGRNFAVYSLTNCRSYITEKQFNNLYTKAIKFCLEECGGLEEMRHFTHFYRSDRITDYGENIDGQFGLTPRPKLAEEGHLVPGVGRIPGIFFFARECEPNLNPFGGRRYLKYPIESVISDPRKFDFYFMDIKCYNFQIHYITIVVAQIHTQEHEYCEKRLGPSLVKWNNPFLRINRRANKFEYFVPGDPFGGFSKCFIEILLAREGKMIFNWDEMTILVPGPKGKKGVPREGCEQCCHLSPPAKYYEEDYLPVGIEWPSNSFTGSSYPSTPEPK